MTLRISVDKQLALFDHIEDTTGRILKCGGCGAPYHESCLTFQISAEGTCKICGRILLY